MTHDMKQDAQPLLDALNDCGDAQTADALEQSLDCGDLTAARDLLDHRIRLTYHNPDGIAPQVEIQPQDAETPTRGGFQNLAFRLFASLENALRRRQFATMLDTHPGRPAVLAEGDSWFCFPIIAPLDVAQAMANHLPVYPVAAPGQSFPDYLSDSQLAETIAALNSYPISDIALSGGGNEMMGDYFKDHLLPFDGQSSARDFLNWDTVHPTIDGLARQVARYGETLQNSTDRPLRFYSHSYAVPFLFGTGSWLSKDLEAAQIPTRYWTEICALIVATYSARLTALELELDNYRFIDLRPFGRPDAHAWHDEVHLSDAAAKAAGAHFARRIMAAQPNLQVS